MNWLKNFSSCVMSWEMVPHLVIFYLLKRRNSSVSCFMTPCSMRNCGSSVRIFGLPALPAPPSTLCMSSRASAYRCWSITFYSMEPYTATW